MSSEVFHSRVYTDRPAYADFEPAEKFEAIKSIIAKRQQYNEYKRNRMEREKHIYGQLML